MIRKTALLFIITHFVIGISLAQERKSSLEYELSASLGNNQILKASNNYLQSSSKYLSKSFASGIAVDLGCNVMFPLGRAKIKTGIHLNNWNSNVRIENKVSEDIMVEEGVLSITRITIPIIFRLGKIHSKDFLNLSHEMGLLVDYNVNFASKYFNIRYFERVMDRELFLLKDKNTKTVPGYRLHYGLRSSLSEKLSIHMNANVGFTQVLMSAVNCFICGVGLTQEQLDDLQRGRSFNKILNLNTTVGISYRIFN